MGTQLWLRHVLVTQVQFMGGFLSTSWSRTCTAISRERDELLALVDVAERLKYEQGKSRIAEDEYGSFSSSELAVLGACKCRLSSPEPCGCAHAAANLRKEVAKLRDEGEWLQQRWEECSLTVDAYRSAFEEQLCKSRKLSQCLSQIATLSSRSAKAKAAIKWLIQVMNDGGYS
ncbi:coiled-coil domain-containing protein 125 [Plakobranchus ocellatus]|uniref:Coiled-coil domain-containing protein 125 n=1 Tax=Plakobranchus ocellatus TaxID=259542 RepID=A0AAV4CWK8_9GAST|nr:coiled-coil domain-containing protein 125 [Plakobranchus ocellatus]